MSDLSRLAGASSDDARRFFAEADPVALVESVTGTDDDALLELLGTPEVRTAAIPGILDRLHEFAIPERLRAVSGVVRFDLLRRGRLLEQHALEFAGGRIARVDPGADADVVLSTSLLRFVRLVSGERNAGLEFLSGKLDIDGDADLALAVGGIFRVPGRGDVAVDPSALDPVDVATVLRDVPSDHLRKVMSGPFRRVVLGEIFRRLPDFVDPRKAARTELVVAFRLTGGAGPEPERYVVAIDRGSARVLEEAEAGEGLERHATITCAGHDFLRLATGHLSPVTGVMRGTLKVRGDKARALQLSSLIDFPQPR